MVTQLIFLLAFTTFAGRLDDFEKSVKKERHSSSRRASTRSSYDDRTNGTSAFGRLMGTLFFKPFLHLAMIPILSATEFEATNDPHTLGDLTRPFFKADINYQYVDSDIKAIDGEVEAGYELFGAKIRRTHFSESPINDTLDITQYLGLIRISSSPKFELDLALGALTVEGDESNTGFSTSIPIQFHPNENIGLQFKPSWSSIHGNTIQDYDLALILTYGVVSLQGGYRVLKVEGEQLDGPYGGLSIHF